ncbi:MAG: response regulator [Verrucomicrobia bacterium]|nr:response regulator [Verrucomicrobiota bacterium]
MNAALLPPNEAERLEALRRYQILDTPPEAAFDDLARLAASECGAPFAYISFVDEARRWVKSSVGLPPTTLPREQSFCARIILAPDALIVEDTLKDLRFAELSAVTDDPHLRFFAGFPLVTPDGFKLGSLCVADRQGRSITRDQQEALRILAHQVIVHLELRRHVADLERSLAEEERAKDALRNSEAFYATLVESLPQFIIRKDREGRFTFANQRFCKALGQPLAEILGRTDHDFYPRHLADKYHRDDQRVMATRFPIDTVEANIAPDGTNMFVHVIKTPLVDATGQVSGIQGIFWDVTERKKIEEQLAYERDLLRALLENIPDRIYFKDVASRFLRASRSLTKRLGLPDPKEIVGKTDFDIHPPEAAQEYYQEEQRIILTGQPLVNKLQRSTDKDGRDTWASVTKVPIFNRNNAITGIVGISRDITKLKQAEEALETARDAALETARIKSEFLANMSHEIRTPMNAIVGMADLLLDTPLSTEQQEFAETIRNSTDTLLHLINEILDFSKMEAGKLVIETIDFDLRKVIESTADMLADRAQRKGVEVACWLDDDVPTRLRGDPSRLRQVLTNLLANAIKFTERGEVVVRVTKQQETSSRVKVRVSVIDTGIGIPPKVLPLIFQAFTQADGSTTRKYGGTGLGLAISRQLVELMGGEISVESTEGQGSSFSFVLPLEKQPESAAPPPPPEPRSLEGARVLVVDDNATNRKILRHQLDRWHVRNEAAGDGFEALRLLREAAQSGPPFTLAILDMQMPEMDGLALAHAIKGDPLTAATRLVMLTSIGHRLDAETRFSAGIEKYLVKPVKQSRLFDTLVTVLSSVPSALAEVCAPAQASGGRPAASAVDPSKVRILLAEDNPVNLRLALKLLEKLGCKADAVTNGREALQAAETSPYDIILMDCQMPEMDGYEVTVRLREAEKSLQSDRKSSAYIIALTANALDGDRERGLAAGMNDYLTKPVRMEDLRGALERAYAHFEPRTASFHPPADEVLDPSVLASLKELREPGQPDPVAELIHLYLKDAKPRIDSLECFFATRKAAEMKSVAHSLKGSSNNLGARGLAGLFLELEHECKAGHWENIRSLLPRVKAEFRRVQERLLAEVHS